MQHVIFASTSHYKQKQLKQLGLIFESLDPGIEEHHNSELAIDQLALHLSLQKAQAIAAQFPSAIVLGSDQTAEDQQGHLLTKPGSFEAAKRQLLNASGQTHHYHSAITLLHSGRQYQAVTTTKATFRQLTEAEIDRYLTIDQPLDCVGSFKVEALGISLFEAIESTDPSALIGLPLIATAQLLRHLNLSIP